MRIPKDEIPSVEVIRELARINLPSHYRLLDVRFSYGSELGDFLPDDFEITIEYEIDIDPDLQGTLEEVERFQSWAHALMQDIRGDWPPESLRINFYRRASPEKESV